MPYTYTGTYTECSEGGTPLTCGDIVKEPDQRLIDAGLLIPTPEEPAAPAAPAPSIDKPKESDANASGN